MDLRKEKARAQKPMHQYDKLTPKFKREDYIEIQPKDESKETQESEIKEDKSDKVEIYVQNLNIGKSSRNTTIATTIKDEIPYESKDTFVVKDNHAQEQIIMENAINRRANYVSRCCNRICIYNA